MSSCNSVSLHWFCMPLTSRGPLPVADDIHGDVTVAAQCCRCCWRPLNVHVTVTVVQTAAELCLVWFCSSELWFPCFLVYQFVVRL
jgi:hypothetical protein